MGWLTFWNPKNLQKKVDMYGYHFSWKTHAVMIFLALAGVIGIGAVFRLKAGGVVIALTAVIMMLPHGEIYRMAGYLSDGKTQGRCILLSRMMHRSSGYGAYRF